MTIFKSTVPLIQSAILILLSFASGRLVAGDWPQILGPNRDGVAEGEQLPDSWPDGGPKTIWEYDVGSGFAGPVVVGNRVIVFHRVGDQERVEALTAADGKQLWQADFDASYRGTINPDDGPRCVPVVSGDAVFVFGAAGDVHCVSLADGKKRWSRDTFGDYDASEGYFGAGSTPIVIDGKLLVNVGGRDGAGIVAFDVRNGKTLWTAGDEQASYSSPTVLDRNGKPVAVFVTRLNALLVDPSNGDILARNPFGARGPTVNAATPLVIDGNLFLTASYGVGATLLTPTSDELKTVWESDDVLSSQYNTPVYRDGYLYGIHGREDIGEALLRCVALKTGKVQWSEDAFGVAHLILAGEKLLIARINGELVLAKASPERFQMLSKTQAFGGTLRAIPALAHGNLYARDDKQLKCIAVGE